MAFKVSKQPEPGRHDSNAVIMAHHKKPRLQARAIVSISYNEKGFGQTEAIRAYRAGAISEHPPWVHPKAPWSNRYIGQTALAGDIRRGNVG